MKEIWSWTCVPGSRAAPLPCARAARTPRTRPDPRPGFPGYGWGNFNAILFEIAMFFAGQTEYRKEKSGLKSIKVTLFLSFVFRNNNRKVDLRTKVKKTPVAAPLSNWNSYWKMNQLTIWSNSNSGTGSTSSDSLIYVWSKSASNQSGGHEVFTFWLRIWLKITSRFLKTKTKRIPSLKGMVSV